MLFGIGLAWAVGFLDAKVVEAGKPVPDFRLQDTAGRYHTLSEYRGKVVMIHFWSATCPYVLRYEDRLQSITRDYADQGVVVLAIDSNVNETVDQIKEVAQKRALNYPILMDPGNKVADQFGAITTPHLYIIDRAGNLVFEGAVDNQGWSAENPVTERYARGALDKTLSGEPVPHAFTKTVGCTIKRAF